MFPPETALQHWGGSQVRHLQVPVSSFSSPGNVTEPVYAFAIPVIPQESSFTDSDAEACVDPIMPPAPEKVLYYSRTVNGQISPHPHMSLKISIDVIIPRWRRRKIEPTPTGFIILNFIHIPTRNCRSMSYLVAGG